MKKNLQWIAILMVFAVSACQKEDVQQPSSEITSSVSTANERAAASNINLSVTVEPMVDINGIPTAAEINSDGAEYIHGKQQVEAQILSSDGNFYMNTNSNTVKPTLRWLVFDQSDFPSTVMNNLANYSLRTTIGDTWLQNMLEGADNFKLVGFRIWGVKPKGSVDWRLVYKNGYESDTWEPNSLTDYAKVIRLGPGQWTIEPAAYSATPANAALYPGAATSSSDRISYHVLPFKLTLTKIIK